MNQHLNIHGKMDIWYGNDQKYTEEEYNNKIQELLIFYHSLGVRCKTTPSLLPWWNGRHNGLKIRCRKASRFKSGREY